MKNKDIKIVKQISDKFNIVKILTENGWIETNDYIVAVTEYHKKQSLTLIYNNKRIKKIVYQCSNCFNLIETDWGKFVSSQILKNKCLCRQCTIKSAENRKLVSERTRLAMQNQEVKQHQKMAQAERWKRQEEHQKASVAVKKVMARPKQKEKISQATKLAMSKIDRSKLNPTKNMTQEEILIYREKISKSKKASYNSDIKERFRKTRKETFKNRDTQEKFINSFRNNLIRNKSQIQALVEYFVKNELNLQCIDEFPINIYDLNIEHKFFLIDIAFDNKIGIEVLGDFYHLGLIAFLNTSQDKQSIINSMPSDFHKNRCINDLFKYEFLKKEGWKILYVTQTQIFNDDWKAMIKMFLHKEGII